MPVSAFDQCDGISIHRSLAGPDGASGNSLLGAGISIHRSLAGPDSCPTASVQIGNNFNPQVPCGTRQTGVLYYGFGHNISIHRSLAGPDAFFQTKFICHFLFQSTGPLRDPTSRELNREALYLSFQSTGPLRDPTPPAHTQCLDCAISIHRSLAGPDVNKI